MKINQIMFSAVAVLSALSAACTQDVGSEEEIATSDDAIRIMNGDLLSGVALTGATVSGVHFSGVDLAAMHKNGVALSNVVLEGTKLSGSLPTGATIRGEGFAGVEMNGILSDGTARVLRIDTVRQSLEDPDFFYYTISYLNPSGSRVSVCGHDANGAVIQAFPLAGRYDTSEGTDTGGDHINDPDHFSIACRGSALAKCAEFGYKPFKEKAECASPGNCQMVDLAPVHQACVRMIRADYCGDGRSHTYTGTEVDVYDGLGIKSQDPVAWDLEAEWTTGGAQCVSHTRWVSVNGQSTSVADYIQTHCPSKLAFPRSGVECGGQQSTFFTANGYSTPLDTRVLLRNKSQQHQ